MSYYKLSFYVEAKSLESAYESLEELISGGGMADTEEEVSLEEFADYSGIDICDTANIQGPNGKYIQEFQEQLERENK